MKAIAKNAMSWSFERSKMVFNLGSRHSQVKDPSISQRMPAGTNRPSWPRAIA
ncbi:MAG: hypothetical protein P4L90_21905 [Rhodopila sp.]|nr:hypothetical protein [Rhodopila sp.]